MKASDMIRAALTFPLSMTDLVTKTIMHLPEILRPTVISLAEDEPATAIGDINVFLDTFKMPTIGVYLENSTVQYDLRRFQKNTLIVDADLGDISDDVVRDFLIHMAAPRPFFGFACTQKELEYRNRITTNLASTPWKAGSDVTPGDIYRVYIGGRCCRPHWPSNTASRSLSSWSVAGTYRAGRTSSIYCVSTTSRRIGVGGRHGGIVPFVSRHI